MMLWDADGQNSPVNAVADDDDDLDDERDLRPLSNMWMGPYSGPTTIRRFLVVHEGVRSSYCL